MEPILIIKGLEIDDRATNEQKQVEDLLRAALLTQGAAYDHIGFSWVQVDESWTVYGYGWWDND